MAVIHYFSEVPSFKLKNKRATTEWLLNAARREGATIGALNFIFCSDAQLLKINQEYLNHNTYTDIITFDSREVPTDPIEGDIFISVERIADNARRLNVAASDELHRVMIHGLLHLIGYSDKSPVQKARMRKKEDAYLSLRRK